MSDELTVRQMAVRLRLAGESIESICSTLNWTPLHCLNYMDLLDNLLTSSSDQSACFVRQ